jgi:hypothetical protein
MKLNVTVNVEVRVNVKVKVNVKIKIILEQATKAKRGCSDIALLFP